MDLTPIFNQAWSRKMAVSLTTIVTLFMLASLQPAEGGSSDAQTIRLGLWLIAGVGTAAVAVQGFLDYLRPKQAENGTATPPPGPPKPTI